MNYSYIILSSRVVIMDANLFSSRRRKVRVWAEVPGTQVGEMLCLSISFSVFSVGLRPGFWYPQGLHDVTATGAQFKCRSSNCQVDLKVTRAARSIT